MERYEAGGAVPLSLRDKNVAEMLPPGTWRRPPRCRQDHRRQQPRVMMLPGSQQDGALRTPINDEGATPEMITAADADFHQPDDDDPTWGETNFFGFYSADEPLNVGVYTLFRPNLGVVLSTISMNSGDAYQPWRADFCDHQAQLPIPEPRSLANYTLNNGLSVRTVVPNDTWEIDYDDGQGTKIDVTYRALMPAFDIHDPAMDPIAAAQQEAARLAASSGEASGFAWGTAYNGHFDQTGRVTGEVVLRGRRIPIDCVSTMDHSWGPRKERGGPNMSWLHAHFADDHAMHGIFSFDEDSGGRDLTLTHGYVIKDGRAVGLASGTGRTERDEEFFARRVSLSVLDADGDTHELTGEGLTRFPWQAWPNMVGFNVLARWTSGGHTGYGEIQDFVDLTRLTAMNSKARTGAAMVG